MDVTNHVNTMFVCLPGVNGIEWPEDIKSLFQKNYAKKGISEPWKDYIYLRIQGCTFSGDPYTTVRNTVASDVYGMFYRFMAGCYTPWEDNNNF